MSYLKLDARHPECHGLARALVGSPLATKKPNGEDCLLVGIRRKFMHKTFVTDESGSEDEILLPLDTLQVCPFVANREKIAVTLHNHPTDASLFGATLDLDNLPKGAEVVE